MSMENFKTRKEAEQAERKAIKEEKPLHNKAHADMPDTVGFFHLVFKYALTKNKKYAFGAKKLFNRESMPSACHRKLWDALPD